MKNYSQANRPGDEGKTFLVDGACNKNTPRVEAYGSVDELNSLIGLARASAGKSPVLNNYLGEIQRDLFVLGSELATVSPQNAKVRCTNAMVKRLELQIGEMGKGLPPLVNFILPGGSELSARLHVARAVCRRAERRVLVLSENSLVASECKAYLNRLSDWLFVASRLANHELGVSEPIWDP